MIVRFVKIGEIDYIISCSGEKCYKSRDQYTNYAKTNVFKPQNVFLYAV